MAYPVIDRRHQTGGRFTHDQFRYEPAENAYYCPEGKALRYRGLKVKAQSYIALQRHNAKVVRRRSAAHQVPTARCLSTGTTQAELPYALWLELQLTSGRAGSAIKIEALFAELKQQMGLRRVRLRRLWNVSEQFLLAATAQNLKRLVRFLAQRTPTPASSGA